MKTLKIYKYLTQNALNDFENGILPNFTGFIYYSKKEAEKSELSKNVFMTLTEISFKIKAIKD